MKYIRLFENRKKLVSDIKDYFIDDMSNVYVYYLFRVDNRNSVSNHLDVTKLYIYDFSLGSIEKTTNERDERYTIPVGSFDILFQSDSLEFWMNLIY